MPDLQRVEISWRADGGGAAEAQCPVAGWLERVITVPDATDAPDDNYDITIEYEDGADLAEGLLANRDTANTEVVYPVSSLPTGHARIWIPAGAWVKVANAGADNAGIVAMFVVTV